MKLVQYGNAKKGFLSHGRGWCKTQCFCNTWWAKRMSIFVIMYAMLCTQTRYVVCSKCYGHISEWSHDDLWTILRISLNTLEELRACFVCGGDKRFIVRCYIGTSFVTDTNNLSQLGYVFNKRWHNGMEGVPCWIWMSSKVKHCDGFYKRRLSISLFWQRQRRTFESRSSLSNLV